MITPTPVDLLPSFTSDGTASLQPGSNKWLPYLIVGGVIIIAIGISMTVNRKIQRDIMKLKMEDDERKKD